MCLFVIALSIGCGERESPAPVRDAAVEEVTVPQLFAAPRKFDDARVRVVGFCTIGTENDFLRPTEDQTTPNAIRLALPDPLEPGLKRFNLHFVVVEGRVEIVNTTDPGWPAGFIASLNNISMIDLATPEQVARARKATKE